MAPENSIKHLIVLMLENRSFDHMLGSLQRDIPDLDGVDMAGTPRTNRANGKIYKQLPGAARVFPENLDPQHEYPNVQKQLGKDNGGFAQDFADSHPHATEDDIKEVMKYYAPGDLPALHALAKAYTVCDRWFASVPGPTWPNRFFAHSGTSLGHLTMPSGLFNLNLHWYSQDTIYDRLNAKKRRWQVYYGDVPQSLLLVHQLSPWNLTNYHHIPQFMTDAGGKAADFPDFAFIEPEYNPPGQNDDHPPHDVLNGDQLIANVYNALRHNEELFAESLLIITWDEHGGFYDHVPPVAADPPDNCKGDFGFDFKSTGLRVPALLVSPYAFAGACHTVFDHTSILRTATDLFGLAPLTNRVARASNVTSVLSQGARPIETLPRLINSQSPLPAPLPRPAPDTLNPNQSGLTAYAQYLGTSLNEDPLTANARLSAMMNSARAQIDGACDQTDQLIRQTRQQEEARVQERPTEAGTRAR